MEVFIVLAFDGVRRGNSSEEKLVGVRAATTEREAKAIEKSEWGRQFTYTEIEKRELEGYDRNRV